MTVIALTSTRSSPGVTTTAIALTYAWPRPALLVEADVAGSSSVKAGHLRGEVEAEPNLVDLAIAHRNNALNLTAIREASITLPLDNTRALLPGLVTSSQRVHLTTAFWEALASLLASLPRHGVDVIIDAGRHGMVAAPDPLTRRADLFAVLTRSRLDGTVNVAANAAELRGAADVATDRVGLVVIGEGRPYSARDVARATGLPLWATIANDPVAADQLNGGRTIASRARFDRTSLMRSVRSAANELEQVHNRRQDVLGTPSGGNR